MELKEMIEVMQHFDNGGKVESRYISDEKSRWNLISTPTWDWFDYEYRIKEQKPKVTIEKWLCKDKKDNYIVIEGSNVDFYCREKVKLLETYEVEI